VLGTFNWIYQSDWLYKKPWGNLSSNSVLLSTDTKQKSPRLIHFPGVKKKRKFNDSEATRFLDARMKQFEKIVKDTGLLDRPVPQLNQTVSKVWAPEPPPSEKAPEPRPSDKAPLPYPLEGRSVTDPNWCTMADYWNEYWDQYGDLTKDGPHELLQEMEMSFPNACVKDGILHVHQDSPDIWKMKESRDIPISGPLRGGGVLMMSYNKKLYPYMKVVTEDMTSWGLPMDKADALISISNYVDYLAEFFKNGVAYLWALFKHGIITENMWFVPLYPQPPGDPPGWLPAYIEALIRPFTKRCLMRFRTWLQHDRCYPRVHIRHWTGKNWTGHYPWGKFREEYIDVATKIMEYYRIAANTRPKDKFKIGIIKRGGLRQVLNHDELVKRCNEDIISPDGRKVECVSLPIEVTNVTAMSHIRTLHVLVGIHGAGLLNGIFLHPGTGVLELFPAKVFPWNFDTYPNDLKVRSSPRLHYEGLHVCNISLTKAGTFTDLRWQTTSQNFPWQHVRRRLQNVVNHLGDKTYPIIVEQVPGGLSTPACQRGTWVMYTKAQARAQIGEVSLSPEYLGLPEGVSWEVHTLKKDQRR